MALAASKYEQAISLNSKNPHFHYRLGTVQEKLGKKKQAKDHYQAALSLNPQMGAARKALDRVQQLVE